MAEATDSGLSLRTERKALQKAKILQRESERNVVRLVRRANISVVVFHPLRLASGTRLTRLKEALALLSSVEV